MTEAESERERERERRRGREGERKKENERLIWRCYPVGFEDERGGHKPTMQAASRRWKSREWILPWGFQKKCSPSPGYLPTIPESHGNLCLTIWGAVPDSFPRWLLHFTFPPAVFWVFQFLHCLLFSFLFLNYIHPSQGWSELQLWFAFPS